MLCTLSVYVCRPQLPPTAFLYQLTQPHPIIKLYCSVFYCLEFQWYFSPPRKKWPPHYYICSHNTANPSSTHTVWSSYQTVTDPYPVTQAVWLECKCITKLLCVFRTGWSWLSITEQKCKDSFTPYTVLQCCMAWLSGSKPHARTHTSCLTNKGKKKVLFPVFLHFVITPLNLISTGTYAQTSPPTHISCTLLRGKKQDFDCRPNFDKEHRRALSF